MIQIYFEGDLFFNELKKDIINAKKYIFIEFYIFQYEIKGREILNLLIKKNREDKVIIKILIDGVGSKDYIDSINEEIQHTNIELCVYKPFHFKLLLKTGYHRRNHRKLILIDDYILYTGGMNIKDVMSKKVMGDNRWRDTMIKIQNTNNIEIKRIFFQCKFDFLGLWRISKRGYFFLPKLIPILPSLNKNKNFYVFSSINKKRRRIFRKFYYDFINSAQKFLYIATPYFVPPLKLIRLLKHKAEHGVDIKILTAGNTDVWWARQAGRATYTTLLKSNVKIYEFSTRIFHAKQTLSENGLILGSSNIDYRSFLHNLEIDFFISDKNLINKTLKQFTKDLQESNEIKLEEWADRSIFEKITENLSYAYRYYL